MTNDNRQGIAVGERNWIVEMPGLARYDMNCAARDAYSEVFEPSRKRHMDHAKALYAAVDTAGPHMIAAELERLADDWDAEAAQIKSSPCCNGWDEYTTDEIAVRVAALRKRAAELKAGA